ncbi:phage virion morphogenesis protein [Frederiksenia canicola]
MIHIQLNADQALRGLNRTAENLKHGRKLYGVLGEALRSIHKDRFEKEQASPEGEKWKPLVGWYRDAKGRNKDKILIRDGNLKNLLRYQASDRGVVFGSDRKYARLHQYGGTITPKRAKVLKLGDYGVARKVKIPARPWLGVSKKNEGYLLEKTEHFLRNVIARG